MEEASPSPHPNPTANAHTHKHTRQPPTPTLPAHHCLEERQHPETNRCVHVGGQRRQEGRGAAGKPGGVAQGHPRHLKDTCFWGLGLGWVREVTQAALLGSGSTGKPGGVAQGHPRHLQWNYTHTQFVGAGQGRLAGCCTTSNSPKTLKLPFNVSRATVVRNTPEPSPSPAHLEKGLQQ